MRHILANNILTISADSEDSSFPVENVMDHHPKRVYKANSYAAVVFLDVTDGVSDIVIAGTNAVSASILGSDPNEISWGGSDIWGPGDTWHDSGFSLVPVVADRIGEDAMWITFPATATGPAEYQLTLATDGVDNLAVGIIRANIATTYGADPNYGVNETRVDYSIKKELSNGSRYYKKRDIVRTFRLTAELENDYAQALMNSFDTLGEEPTGWRLTDIDSADWVVFGRFSGPPTISHEYFDYSVVNWTITEVL
jgi:hypothetical protein